MTARESRQIAALEFLRLHPPVPACRVTQPGTWHLMGGREGTKRALALAWLSHRAEDARDSSSGSEAERAMESAVEEVIRRLEYEWRSVWEK